MDQDLDLEVSKPRRSHSLVLLLHHSLQEDLQEREGALAIRRIFSLVDMITKPKFSNCPNVFTIGLFW